MLPKIFVTSKLTNNEVFVLIEKIDLLSATYEPFFFLIKSVECFFILYLHIVRL